MYCNTGNGNGTKGYPNFVGSCFNTETGESLKMLVEWPIVPEIGFTATNAAMPTLDWKAHPIIPTHHSTGIVSVGTTTSHFVKAEATFGIFIVPGFNKQTCIIIR